MEQDSSKVVAGTQERLLEAAMDIFGSVGYDTATTRVIAKAAEVNIAAIPYYYKGKEGLYRAVISRIVEMIQQQVAAMGQTNGGMTFEGRDKKEKALRMLEKQVTKMIKFMIGSSQGPRISRIILREQMYPSAAYDLIFKGFMEPVLNSFTTMIITITENPSKRTARLLAMTIMGQILVFRVARETIVRSLDLEGYNAEEVREIQTIVLQNIRNILQPLM
jgi:TetR/AcrR family transcriptional regulator, regulator of cefoperazone and chloramphenicol sensitivity